jgi:Uma2 family endonuclease
MSDTLIDELEDEKLYPSSDGKPMGETDFHVLSWVLLLQALEDLTQDIPDVHVAGNMFLYYEEGNPKARRAPDAMVTFGVPRRLRRTFKTWVEKAVPSTVFEITSRRTKKQDVLEKPEIYAKIGIKEYILFDPEYCYLKPPFQGFRLQRGKYAPLKLDADGSLVSQELKARIVPEGHMLRFIDLRTGKPVLTRRELWQAAQDEADRAQRAEAELAQLKAKLARNGK